MSVIGVIQARMSSTRLPGKVLAGVGGSSLLQRLVERLEDAGLDRLWVATTTDASDDPIEDACRRLTVDCERGSEHDVLSRFARIAHRTGASTVVRITADNPFTDPRSLRRCLQTYAESTADHVEEVGLPLGCTAEVVRAAALVEAARESDCAGEREHVTLFFKRRPYRYRLQRLMAPTWLRRPELRFTVDTAADLEFVRALVRREPCPRARLERLLAAATREPELWPINAAVEQLSVL